MDSSNPYQLSVSGVQDTATDQIKEHLARGLSIDAIISGIETGIVKCEKKIRKDKFNIDAIGHKFFLENKLIAAKKMKAANTL